MTVRWTGTARAANHTPIRVIVVVDNDVEEEKVREQLREKAAKALTTDPDNIQIDEDIQREELDNDGQEGEGEEESTGEGEGGSDNQEGEDSEGREEG